VTTYFQPRVYPVEGDSFEVNAPSDIRESIWDVLNKINHDLVDRDGITRTIIRVKANKGYSAKQAANLLMVATYLAAKDDLEYFWHATCSQQIDEIHVNVIADQPIELDPTFTWELIDDFVAQTASNQIRTAVIETRGGRNEQIFERLINEAIDAKARLEFTNLTHVGLSLTSYQERLNTCDEIIVFLESVLAKVKEVNSRIANIKKALESQGITLTKAITDGRRGKYKDFAAFIAESVHEARLNIRIAMNEIDCEAFDEAMTRIRKITPPAPPAPSK